MVRTGLLDDISLPFDTAESFTHFVHWFIKKDYYFFLNINTSSFGIANPS